MDLKDAIKDSQLRMMNLVHRTVLTFSGGRFGATLANMPVYKVTTIGRVSGQPRTVILTVPVRRDGIYVFVASKGGDDRNPDWYQNMVANPEFTIEPVDGNGPITLIARTATVEEKAELWPQIVATHGGYDGYQSSTDRDIPVVVAEPAVT
ncbi:MAG: nitroreductase/quinone reductase family protein [Acidimicrobiales bacterium]